MVDVVNLIGEKFGGLIVESFARKDKRKMKWLCRCKCGNYKIAETSALRAGRTKSCGCLRQEIRQQALQTYPNLFWLKVEHLESGCWVWKGSKNKYGYGETKYNGKSKKAHRLSWELTYGPIPYGLFVCHKCDNPPCIRPSHLFLGTPSENMQDRISKGR